MPAAETPFPPAPVKVKVRRDRNHPSPYRYVRRAKGRRYQCRAWLPLSLGSINLGLNESEWEAGRASREFVQRCLPGVPLGDVLDGLRRDGIVPPHVRLKYAVDLPGGGYAAVVRTGQHKVTLPGPYPTETAACNAMVAELAARVPSRWPNGRAKGKTVR